MYTTHSIRITNTSTRDSPRQRRIEDTRRAFASTVGKEDILPATAIRKRITIASLEEGTIQDQDAMKEEH
jgi:signal transduction histidine kinase